MTRYERVDQIWSDSKNGLIAGPDAVAAIRELINVTEYGAFELLDHEVRPSERVTR